MRSRVLFLLFATLLACGGKKEDPAAGHALLAEYIEGFRVLAGGGSTEILEPMLAEQTAKLEELKAAGKVSAAFAERHRRLIEVTRAVITPNAGEAEKQKVRDFLDAVEGKKERALQGGLAEFAPALAEEVLSLHMLLDRTTDREKARAKYLPQLAP